jgi:hypothetical protein
MGAIHRRSSWRRPNLLPDYTEPPKRAVVGEGYSQYHRSCATRLLEPSRRLDCSSCTISVVTPNFVSATLASYRSCSVLLGSLGVVKCMPSCIQVVIYRQEPVLPTCIWARHEKLRDPRAEPRRSTCLYAVIQEWDYPTQSIRLPKASHDYCCLILILLPILQAQVPPGNAVRSDSSGSGSAGARVERCRGLSR